MYDKMFVSRYYLDMHMEAHYFNHHLDHNGELDYYRPSFLCSTDRVFEALGGMSENVGAMEDITVNGGRGEERILRGARRRKLVHNFIIFHQLVGWY
jgi:hypothetical protein